MTAEQSRESGAGVNGPAGRVSRRAFLASGAAASVAAVAGCTENALEPSDGGSGAVTGTSTGTTTGSLPNVQYRHRFRFLGLGSAANTAGVDLGAWEAAGVNVEFLPSSGSQAAVQSVAQGKDEFGNAEIAAVLKLIQEDAPLRIIAQVIDPIGGVISLGKSGITSWGDLEGKTVGRFPWGTTAKLAPQAMAEAGSDPDAVEWRNMQPGAQEKLLIQGDADAVVAYFPQAEVRLQNRGYETTVLRLSEQLPYLGVSLFTRTDVLENRPEVVNSFVRGWLRANQLFVTDLKKVIEVQQNYVPDMDPELERRTLGPLYAARVPPAEVGREHGKGWTPPEALEGTQSVLHEAGMLERTRAIDSYYTNEFIERNRELAVETAETYYEELAANYDIGPDYV